MWRLFKVLFVLLVIAGLALVAYAYLGPLVTPADFAPDRQEVVVPVTLSTEP